MAHIGKLGEFSDGKETFVNYVERMEQYFEANEVKNDKRVAVFLSVVGPTTYGVLKNLLQPALPKEKSFKDIVKTLTDYYMPKPLVISERFKFNKRNQREGETVNEYVCELKNSSKYCEFGDFLKEALRDRLVCGLRSEAIQKKLLSEADLTFEKAKRIATAMETAEKDTLSFTGNSTPVHYVKSKPNHWRDRKGKNQKPMVAVRQCFRCWETSGKTKDYSVDLELGDKLVKFQIDTGSARTIVNEAVYRNRLSEYNLKKSSASLKSYTKEDIPVLGEFEVTAKYGEQCVPQILLLVVKGNQPCLLGRDWLSKIRLNWENIFSVTNGSARPVHYALKEKVEAELKKLEERGVIYPVKTSEWAAPIVVVPKPDKSVRLCGDYKVTVNRVISEEQYPLPNTDDMFATLAGGQKFTKLDLRQAYSQLELSSDSEEYLTVNTHLGIYRYRRLAYGVSSASAIFQGAMDKILSGLPYVVCRIDDILITAPDDDSHVKTIQEVFRRLREHNITLRKDKCIFMADQVIYMGFLVDKHGIHPTDEKIAAIRDAPRPKDVKGSKSILRTLELLWSIPTKFKYCTTAFTPTTEKGGKLVMDRRV
ncbi:uncharacterized protein K02A2.6-like [Saccostrea cucullata]|uniref:uncharacterized protein K02A2.6-like n=1 Tax=Saccostrea cuccullata TaxID=36930 RepID=UPI002ED4C7E0